MSQRTDGGRNSGDEPSIDAEDDWLQVGQGYYDPEAGGELTTEIVSAIAEARGVDLDEIKSPPLYEVVNVAAIEDVFYPSERHTTNGNGTGTTEFRYEEFLVRVQSDGWIRVFTDTAGAD